MLMLSWKLEVEVGFHADAQLEVRGRLLNPPLGLCTLASAPWPLHLGLLASER